MINSHDINMGNLVSKLLGSGKKFQDDAGNWKWDKILESSPISDRAKAYAAEYCQNFYTENGSLPSSFTIIESGKHSFKVVDVNGVILYSKSPPTTPLPSLHPDTLRLKKRVKVYAEPEPVYDTDTGKDWGKDFDLPTLPAKKKTRKKYDEGEEAPKRRLRGGTSGIQKHEEIDIFHPLYFPYIFALDHPALWRLWVISKFLFIWSVKGTIAVSKAAISVSWVTIYWTWQVVFIVMKYGMYFTVMVIPWFVKIILWVFSFGLVGDILPKKKKKKKGWYT